MRKKVLFFIITSLVIFSIIPAVNIIWQFKDNKFRIPNFFNIDFIASNINSLFYKLGISLNPNQAIIGKEGWIFLGDQYGQAITSRREGINLSSYNEIITQGFYLSLWDKYFKSKGVRSFKVLIGPDKETIYSENLPNWSKFNINEVTDTLIFNDPLNIFIDPRLAIINAKKNYPGNLYFKIDTHWNELGGWLGYLSLSKEVSKTIPELNWLEEKNIHINDKKNINKGDLLRFLKINGLIKDHSIEIDIDSTQPITLEIYNLITKKKSIYNENIPVEIIEDPILVSSKNALNNTKVLWIRDSFGTAMSKFMATTFNEVVHVHKGALNSDKLEKLVDEFKPEIVLVTTVERDSKRFLLYPPPATVNLSMNSIFF
tara:strand:+ start:13872 stop:14990 length:1119 start_codon:yes stop_codon:yes gene_type:complete